MKDVTYFLGCPVWACTRWQGNLFTRDARRDQWLNQYSTVFPAVEGNGTFYGLPSHETVKKWVDSTLEPFHFVLKFPRTISHDHRLLNAEAETDQFLQVLQILYDADRLGPAFLQLPSGFSPHQLDDLAAYLQSLPPEFPYAVEVRHHDFFDKGPNERALHHVLRDLKIDRVIFDSRPLFSAPPGDDYERQSQSRKPQLPVHAAATGCRPLIRLVGRNDVARVTPWIDEWAPVVAEWIGAGLTPYVFTHAPDDRYAPDLARRFHAAVRKHTHRVPDMPDWLGESEPQRARQLALF
jgi:uncharacterized protein YecE (DUF72 family)